MTRQFAGTPFMAFILCALSTLCFGQTGTTTLPPSTPLSNAGFEEGKAAAEPPGWEVRSGSGGTAVLDRSIPFEGQQCVAMDATNSTQSERRFLNMMQNVDAKPYQGKRVRFRAAVQVAELPQDGRVQLWLRVDQPKGLNGKSAASSFDNMSDRPIRNESWVHHDIVLDVAPDADRIYCGAFVIGAGKAWIDDASLQIVGQNVPTTADSRDQPASAATTAKAVPQNPAVEDPAVPPPGQPPAGDLVNGSMEDGEPGAAPPGWRFSSTSGGTVVIDRSGAIEGAQSAMIDATNIGKGRLFTTLTQSFDAGPWQGKRVKFRAAVQVSEVTRGSTVNLWMRVDQPKDEEGATATSAFDNMSDRPIRNEAWAHHEIVLDVAPDAARIVLGMFVVGKGKAWLDDASFTVVSTEVATTGSGGVARSPRRTMHPAVRKALNEAADAPQQPFFTWWLLMPCCAIALFLMAMWPQRRITTASDGAALPDASLPARPFGAVRWFAMHFTLVYWLLYCLPRPFVSVVQRVAGYMQTAEFLEFLAPIGEWLSSAAMWVQGAFTTGKNWVVETSAANAFDIEAKALVPPNGSGDTTYSYIANFDVFVIAAFVAALMVFVRWRPVRYEAWIDLLRTFLRYVLAFYMLGYGLAKIGMERNQFPMIGEGQLSKTWGESSPMNVVWSFMGASRPYTMFGGLCEVLGAVLLIWRRTGTLGALVSIAVMTNVVMLNYCYDVPVKLLSTHLVIMAVVIAAPDVVRLTQLFVLNRTSIAPGCLSIWTGTWQRWTRLTIKAIVITCCFALPIYDNVWGTFQYFEKQAQSEPAEVNNEDTHLLLRRGYRWINEVPFNR